MGLGQVGGFSEGRATGWLVTRGADRLTDRLERTERKTGSG